MPQIRNILKSGSGENIDYLIVGGNSPVDYLNKYLKISEIKKILDRNTIYPRFKIFILNTDETVNYEIPENDIILGGMYNENYQNGTRRTISFSLNNEDGKYSPSINNLWVNTRLALECGIEIPDEGIIIWFKKGIYIINSISPSKTIEKKTVSISCSDKFGLLTGSLGTVTFTTEIPSKTKIKNVIQDILMTSTGNGEILDSKPFFYHPSFENEVLPVSITLSAGDNYGSAITQIADILSAEVFYDGFGMLNFVPIADTTYDSNKPNLYDFSLKNLQNEDFSFNVDSFINCIYVVGANVNGHTCYSIQKNENPLSPICVSRIGLRTGSVINDSNITTDYLAEERAKYELRKKTIAESTLGSSVIFNPLLSVNNIVTFTDKEDFELQRDRFLIQSISFSLDYSGTMSLTVSNTENLPFNF